MRSRPLSACVISIACLSGVACAPQELQTVDVRSARVVTVSPAPASVRDISGRYQSPESGLLELKQSGTAVSGTYRQLSCDGELVGTLQGTVLDNRVQASWVISACPSCAGQPRTADGFFYVMPETAAEPALRLIGKQTFFVTRPGPVYPEVTHTHSAVWTARQIPRDTQLPALMCPDLPLK